MFVSRILIAALAAAFISLGTANASAEPEAFAVIGDAGYWNSDAAAVQASIGRAGVRDLILPGDNLYLEPAGYDSVWSKWFSRGFLAPIVAIGNHTRGYDEEVRYFRMPGEHYSLARAGARFIVLNSDNRRNVDEQMRFLDRELESARERLVFLVYHHPTFTVSRHHHWREREAFQVALRERLLRFKTKLTALLVGHDHMASVVDVNGLPMVVSGSVFEQRSVDPVDIQEGPFRVRTEWLGAREPHWAALLIDAKAGTAKVTFVRARTHEIVHTRSLLQTRRARD